MKLVDLSQIVCALLGNVPINNDAGQIAIRVYDNRWAVSCRLGENKQRQKRKEGYL
jgi:hypothetical protein